MLAVMYRRTLSLAQTKSAQWWLAAVSFLESSVFPIPPDLLLVPMCLARPQRAWFFAGICTVASVLGGVLGYMIGFGLYDQIAKPIIAIYGYSERFEAYQALYREWGLWIILIKGLTPIPYKIVTIASGAAQFDFATFLGASIATRGGRFFLQAMLIYMFGDWACDFIERRLGAILFGFAVLLVLGFALVIYL